MISLLLEVLEGVVELAWVEGDGVVEPYVATNFEVEGGWVAVAAPEVGEEAWVVTGAEVVGGDDVV